MDWRGQRQSSNVEDRRGSGSGGGGFGGMFGGGSGPRLPTGRGGGGLGIGGIVVVLIIAWVMGINPLTLLTGGDILSGGMPGGGSVSEPAGRTGAPAGRAGTPADDSGKFVAAVLGSTEDVWGAIFKANNRTYEPPRLVLFSGQTQSACGFASAAVGPFYCPGDKRVYLDTAFFDELARRFGAPGDFAAAYVIAHEIGHHIQHLTGILGPQGAGSNERSVRVELQADCYAGIWAKEADRRGLVEVGDIDEALNAASQIGDDTLQRRSGGTVQPDSFTHGTSAQRSRWFKRGYESGRPGDCDALNASQL